MIPLLELLEPAAWPVIGLDRTALCEGGAHFMWTTNTPIGRQSLEGMQEYDSVAGPLFIECR